MKPEGLKEKNSREASMWKVSLGRNKGMREIEDKETVVCEDNSSWRSR